MIRVKFSGTLRQISGCRQVEVDLPESRRLEELLEALVVKFPGVLGTSVDYQWRHGSSHVVIAVNDRVIDADCHASTLLSDGDEISLVPPLGGGSIAI